MLGRGHCRLGAVAVLTSTLAGCGDRSPPAKWPEPPPPTFARPIGGSSSGEVPPAAEASASAADGADPKATSGSSSGDADAERSEASTTGP